MALEFHFRVCQTTAPVDARNIKLPSQRRKREETEARAVSLEKSTDPVVLESMRFASSCSVRQYWRFDEARVLRRSRVELAVRLAITLGVP